ncbi:MAG TPA: hypothetical protein VK553_10160 [Candidatus Nitrosopolaris rasttigaisensis]|jgi:hypothetical protein|nr:hypothetical protein [Candidatus Nitrosopolaris rasttigaisensis]
MVRVIVSTLSPLDDNRWSYLVEVTESDGSGSQTRHEVSMDKVYYEKISAGIIGPEDFVKKSFEFLLKREDKDFILKEFNVRQIREYFPEFETEIKKT